MPDQIGGVLPERASHRLLVAYGLAVAGILAVGDGLDVISFPMYQLGLPDTTLANALVAFGGVSVFVGAYRLAVDTVEDAADGRSAADGRGTAVVDGDGDPVRILKARYARGELDDDEYERRLARLEDDGTGDVDPGERQTLVEENGVAGDAGLIDRETVVE